jgi:hypothetical protein
MNKKTVDIDCAATDRQTRSVSDMLADLSRKSDREFKEACDAFERLHAEDRRRHRGHGSWES